MLLLIIWWIMLLNRPLYAKLIAAIGLVCAYLINSDISSGLKSITWIIITLMLLLMIDDWHKANLNKPR